MVSPDALRKRQVRARQAQRKQHDRQHLLSWSKARRRARVPIDFGAVEALGSGEGDGDESRDDEVEGGFVDGSEPSGDTDTTKNTFHTA